MACPRGRHRPTCTRAITWAGTCARGPAKTTWPVTRGQEPRVAGRGCARGPREGTTQWAGDVVGEGAMWCARDGAARGERRIWGNSEGAARCDGGFRGNGPEWAMPRGRFGTTRPHVPGVCTRAACKLFLFNDFFEVIHRKNRTNGSCWVIY